MISAIINDDMIEETLRTLGLTDKEIAIYLALLPLGNAPASVLGNRTKITRSMAQYICQQLVKKGLIRSIQKNNAFIYSPEPPERILFLLEQQKKQLTEKETQVHRIIGDLKSMINPQAVLPKVRFFEGVQGLIDMFEDVLKESGKLYGMLRIEEDTHLEIRKYLNETYIPRRKKQQNPAWILFNDNKATQEYRKNDIEVNRISLLMPFSKYPFDVCCHIYANKVAFYSYKKSDLTGVLIDNTFIYKTQFALFKAAWNYARQLKVNEQYVNVEL